MCIINCKSVECMSTGLPMHKYQIENIYILQVIQLKDYADKKKGWQPCEMIQHEQIIALLRKLANNF